MNVAALFITSSLVWGTTWIAITFQLGNVAPEASVSYRFAIATAIMFLITRLKKIPLRLDWRQQLWMAALGLFYTGNYLSVYRAEIEISSGLVAVAGSCIMFFNILLAQFFLKHQITRRLAIGALLGFTGVCLLFLPEASGVANRYWIGVTFALFAAFAASCANIIAAYKGSQGQHIFATNTWWMLWCTAFTAIAVPLTGNHFSFEYSTEYISSLIYLAVFGSVVAFSSYLSLMDKVGPGKASYIAVITPVIALIISTLFEGMSWSTTGYIGVALIILGQLIIFKRSKDKAQATS
ncbi:MAG: EamA family transporter [Gammaproteobacteria bacterium]|nr:EamA family transporter [Gammaproteobacteria bacterium]